MQMLQERLSTGQLPPLQMPPLSASWPPIGGMTSPGLMSPGEWDFLLSAWILCHSVANTDIYNRNQRFCCIKGKKTLNIRQGYGFFCYNVTVSFVATDTGAGSDSWMRKPRTKFSPDQLQALELEYQMDPFLSTSADKRADLAKKLNITEKNVQIWFQVNNLAKTKGPLMQSQN